MHQIPVQPIEMRCTAVLSADNRLRLTLFPLPSHGTQAPVDTLAGFLNGRRGEFFPVRLADGTETILTLRECLVMELSRKEEGRLLEEFPRMNRDPVMRNEADVVSYARVSLLLKTSRRVQGTLWFYSHQPQNHHNLLDALNSGERYILLHNRSRSVFVRCDAVVRAEVRTDADEAHAEGDADLRAVSGTERGRLVDTEVGFIGATPLPPDIAAELAAQSGRGEEKERHSELFPKPGSGQAFPFSPLAGSGVLPKPEEGKDQKQKDERQRE